MNRIGVLRFAKPLVEASIASFTAVARIPDWRIKRQESTRRALRRRL